ncbi:MAG: ABC transporter permease [Sphingomonadales bacterium]|nr:ABC transporter permease [Sphingomonadales bacterium]
MFGSTFLIALRQLRRNLMRSILTVLGIVIGIGAVIAIVTLGSGATMKVTSEISSLGRNLLIVMRGVRERSPGPVSAVAPAFDAADVDAIRRELADISAVAPTASRRLVAIAGNVNWTTNVIGATPDYFTVREWPVTQGRAFTEAEEKSGRLLCVLGRTTADELFGGQEPVGVKIRLGRQSCEVVGILATKGQSTFGGDQDDLIIVPLKAFQRRLAGNTDIDIIYASASAPEITAEARRNLELLLRERRQIHKGEEDDFTIRDIKEITAVVERTTRTMTTFLGAVAAVSLLVGGIGIMNIMLVSVTERTREIGIRLAIGAEQRDILLQFLVEAVVVSALGGVFGIALGVVGSLIGAHFLNLPFVFEPAIIIIAFAFSSLVGIVFGYFPARRAAHLDPIEALRYE